MIPLCAACLSLTAVWLNLEAICPTTDCLLCSIFHFEYVLNKFSEQHVLSACVCQRTFVHVCVKVLYSSSIAVEGAESAAVVEVIFRYVI